MEREEQPNEVEAAPGVYLPAGAVRFTFSRSGGPGGQNVNKVNTKATLVVAVQDLAGALPDWALKRLLIHAGSRLTADGERLVIHDSSSRSQHANRQACLAKLRLMLIEALHRPKRRRPTKPSRAAIQRRLDNKRHRAKLKTERRPPREG